MEILWRSQIHRDPWRYMSRHDAPTTWKLRGDSMDPHGSPWISMRTHGPPRRSTRIAMGFYGSPRIITDLHGCRWTSHAHTTWTSVDIHGDPPTEIHAPPWIPMGSPWSLHVNSSWRLICTDLRGISMDWTSIQKPMDIRGDPWR